MSVPRWRIPEPLARRLRVARTVCGALLSVLNGDAAYARYCAHHRAMHGSEAPLDRAAFFRAETERRWNGVRRCC
jgi:uncharacterized short protein YbdD (DUF466 family)